MTKTLNISERDYSRTLEIYETFRERAPRRVDVYKVHIPKMVAMIGHLESVDYATAHGSKKVYYRHDFAPGSRPLLCVSPDGKQLLLLGGRFQFTDRGIVDHDREGKEIDNPHHGRPI